MLNEMKDGWRKSSETASVHEKTLPMLSVSRMLVAWAGYVYINVPKTDKLRPSSSSKGKLIEYTMRDMVIACIKGDTQHNS